MASRETHTDASSLAPSSPGPWRPTHAATAPGCSRTAGSTTSRSVLSNAGRRVRKWNTRRTAVSANGVSLERPDDLSAGVPDS